MKRLWGGLCLAILLVGLTATGNRAHEGTGRIYGSAPRGYLVAVQGTSLSAIADRRNGSFEITGVPAGVYFTLVATNEQGDMWVAGNVHVLPGSSTYVPRFNRVNPQLEQIYVEKKEQNEEPRVKLLMP